MIPIARPMIGDEEKRAVLSVLDSGMLAQGPKVKEFEETFARYTGTEHAIATSSGTTALHLSLLSCGIGKGDEVITTPFSFFSTVSTILFCGARPVFVDIEKGTYNINPELIEEAITDRTKAILPVHLFGNPCRMDKIMKIASEYDVVVIEDACQAHGAEHNGRKVGGFGKANCFSFYPTKNMICGEGGIITTSDSKIDNLCRMLRDHGMSAKYRHDILGYNYRMTDIFAAIGIEQLRKLDRFTEIRRNNAEFLNERINEIPGLVPPKEDNGSKHVYHVYAIHIEENFPLTREELIRYLNENGVGARETYPLPLYEQGVMKKRGTEMGYKWEICPVAEDVVNSTVQLPVHPSVSMEDIDTIGDCLEKASKM